MLIHHRHVVNLIPFSERTGYITAKDVLAKRKKLVRIIQSESGKQKHIRIIIVQR